MLSLLFFWFQNISVLLLDSNFGAGRKKKLIQLGSQELI